MGISCLDRRGRRVRCDDRWWDVHICHKHPEMAQLRRELVSTIQAPEAEYRDADHPARRVYYSAYGVGILTSREVLKVSVEYDEYDEGGVITAYATDGVKAGEVLLWQRPSGNQANTP